MKVFKGKALFLDRNDINTDEIIPAKYLTEITKEALKPYLLEDLTLPGFDSEADVIDKAFIVSRENFGCGSSREHAPWALEVNGIYAVIAESFARIFRQNMFNCGMYAIELPAETIDHLFQDYAGKDVTMKIDVDKDQLIITADGRDEIIGFSIGGFDKTLVMEDGWVGYADKNY
ncbi:3-isopropylmalate dehydratase small subunit [Alkalibacter rhizosphaerae]|uniref:3-isopropylmalate dehydratase small subunit n=1 Tax=Alkalibacter rhizosphaerae TaxID=2815577 RepID=A0A974XHP6_9FIRM|nr:3-isopropylmalate dehydratase small subunit [Alkalibacter rhizosphaerae]QSX08568.1 3-isopropylmalate dehydratase small subunit [Alkalibacter rhizosphaerae]